MWKITSPLNFPSDSHIKHGNVKYEYTLPDWTKNNPRVIIEQVDITKKPEETKKEIKHSKVIFEKLSSEGAFCCLTCEERFTSERDLQKHFETSYLYQL